MKRIEISIEDCKYPYYLFEDIEKLSDYICKFSEQYSNSIVICDLNVPDECVERIFGNKALSFDIIKYEVTESIKNMNTVEDIIDKLLEHKANRKTCVYIVGGGVLGNIVGLACGLLYRGLHFVHIPTTIIACSDSCLSLKQGVNGNVSKNILGMYYGPDAVMSCPELYKSLSLRDVAAGYAEFVKNLIIVIPEEIKVFLEKALDFDDLSYEMLEQLVELSVKAKLKLIEKDKYERKDGVLLEYGHTVGHSLELLLPDDIRHGEGVAIGMLVAALLSNEMNGFTKEEVEQLKLLLSQINIFPYLNDVKRRNLSLDMRRLEMLLKKDNKHGYINCQNDEIAMVIMKHYKESFDTDEMHIIPVKLEKVMVAVKYVWEEILQV
ncbi:MAG: hypothetical protein K1W13_00495 [Lachnospiraceae bacterium]